MSHLIVTGGSSGIGLEIARLAVEDGIHVTLLARRKAELNKARSLLQSLNSSVHVFAHSADVSDQTVLSTAIEDSIKELGPPTHLVTSAGIARARLFLDTSYDLFEQMIRVNFLGTVNTVQAVYPAMKRAGRGRIGMIASGAALVGLIGYAAYGSSKFAVRGFAESLRGEAKRDGISITVAYPPDTNTPQLEEENRDKPPETQAIAATSKTWEPAPVAKVIWNALQKARFHATPGFEMTLLSRAHSLLYPLLQRYFDRLVSKVS